MMNILVMIACEIKIVRIHATLSDSLSQSLAFSPNALNQILLIVFIITLKFGTAGRA